MVQHYKQPVSVLVVIYTQALDVLLLERADYPGYWQSVTGSCDETDASLRDTAIREVAEETGINALEYPLTDWLEQNVYEIYPKWIHRYPPGTTHNTEHVFGMELPAPVADVVLELAAHHGLPWQEAAEKVFSPSNRAAILELPKRARGAHS